MEDARCCGTGTCIINDDGYCWCGQQWDGTKMCFPAANHDQSDGAGTSPGPASLGEPAGGH
ncbi:MAG: hypothetical protein HEQ37_03505 [Acidovorax sp.]|jgi:hypothetical protein|uniref:hypothetical protein n=1 Tax=Acidovorax sp. TaxID=1872122 RepID=UPI0025C4768C|nr:hypothetical protein [Acidovorax sp.]MCO4093532.1 hypothetical protein [Acidovorax sp.]MDH4428445.1 hypothetical protein [Acidovorax sp.]MDH4463549.1 hypothetical protein [Acidovorax sp.]